MANATEERPPRVKMTMRVYQVDRHGTVTHDRGTVEDRDNQESLPLMPVKLPVGTVSMRAAASWFLDQETLPRHESALRFGQDFVGFLGELIPEVKDLAEERPEDDAQASVALVGIGEARRRMGEPEAAGLNGEVERVKRLARSVVSLCDHRDSLAGVRMCLACDNPIQPGEDTVPYDRISPSGGAGASGRIHSRCRRSVRSR